MDTRQEKQSVLIADDSAVMRTLITHFISKLGYNALTANDGDACIRMLNSKKVDLLLLDLNMPGKKRHGGTLIPQGKRYGASCNYDYRF